MNNTSKYKIIAIIGEAGSGKDSILQTIKDSTVKMQKFFKTPLLYHEIISCTTRSPRATEQNGVHYYFYTDEEFARKIVNLEMLEATVFNNWCYGTSIDGVEKDLVNIGVFNPEGVESLMYNPDVEVLKVYYIKTPDKERLIRQLNREESPNIDEIIRRYKTDKEDFANLPFQYTVLKNNDHNYDNVIMAADEIVCFLGTVLERTN